MCQQKTEIEMTRLYAVTGVILYVEINQPIREFNDDFKVDGASPPQHPSQK
jgi:hypothetical protein